SRRGTSGAGLDRCSATACATPAPTSRTGNRTSACSTTTSRPSRLWRRSRPPWPLRSPRAHATWRSRHREWRRERHHDERLPSGRNLGGRLELGGVLGGQVSYSRLRSRCTFALLGASLLSLLVVTMYPAAASTTIAARAGIAPGSGLGALSSTALTKEFDGVHNEGAT